MNWYGHADIYSCAQHVEAKELANKLYSRWSGLGDKLSQMALDNTLDFTSTDVQRRFNGASLKLDKTQAEFENARRGLMRCCTIN